MITKDDILNLGLDINNHELIAKHLSSTRTKLVKTEVGNGLILDTVGLDVGNTLLDLFYTDASFRYVKPLLEQGRLDISSPLARVTLDRLVGVLPGFEQQHADALKDLAKVPDLISATEVAMILEGVK